LAVLVCGVAQATPVFMGSYDVYGGPEWGSNPPVYSAREAAALIFGGSPTDYAISISSSLDPATITYTGWYDGWGEHQGMIFDQDYKLDLGNLGYNDPGGEGTARSAYVKDGLSGHTNYVWKADGVPAVPAPAAVLLATMGAACVTWVRGRKML